MSLIETTDDFGVLIEPATLQIRRVLPGPIERVWDYLTKSELRRRWLAAGDMELRSGTTFELVWRNDELSDGPANRPDGFGEESRREMRVLELDPPRKLAFAWPDAGDVTFELRPLGDRVELTVTHRRVPDQATLSKVAPGWHAHLDFLVAALEGRKLPSFWDSWSTLKSEYGRRLSA